jgi:hypothetical protein
MERSHEAPFLKPSPQTLQTAHTDEAYRSFRDPEGLCHLVVGDGRCSEEEHMDQAPATRRQLLNSFVQRLFPAQFIQYAFTGFERRCQLNLVCIQAFDTLPELLSMPTTALVKCKLNQPPGQSPRFSQLMQVRKKL